MDNMTTTYNEYYLRGHISVNRTISGTNDKFNLPMTCHMSQNA